VRTGYIFLGDKGVQKMFEITSTVLQPLTEAITDGLATLVPIGIGVMATFIGISLIKRVIYTFL